MATAQKTTPPAKKTPARKRAAAPIRKGTAPRGAARPKTGQGSKGGQLNTVGRVRHGKFVDEVWERAEKRAAGEGRGIWEVLRQKLAEYADGH